jgi:hypothetical protein
MPQLLVGQTGAPTSGSPAGTLLRLLLVKQPPQHLLVRRMPLLQLDSTACSNCRIPCWYIRSDCCWSNSRPDSNWTNCRSNYSIPCWYIPLLLLWVKPPPRLQLDKLVLQLRHPRRVVPAPTPIGKTVVPYTFGTNIRPDNHWTIFGSNCCSI